MIKEDVNEVQEIGILDKRIVRILRLDYPCRKIMLNPGAIKHMREKHFEEFRKYFARIPEIIEFPNYVGKNPRIPDSAELVKRHKRFALSI